MVTMERLPVLKTAASEGLTRWDVYAEANAILK
jgi:hypothetical protein